MLRTYCLSLLIICCALSSCQIRAVMPPGFLQLETSAVSYKASTGDGALFWVERFDLPPEGAQLEFWIEALEHDLVLRRGYALPDRPTRIQAGPHEGVELIFHTRIGGRDQRYLCSLFVVEGWGAPKIYVARFGADAEVFARRLDGVRAGIRSLRF